MHRHHAISRLSYPARPRAWQFQAWTAFGIALLLCGVGLAWLPSEPLAPAFI